MAGPGARASTILGSIVSSLPWGRRVPICNSLCDSVVSTGRKEISGPQQNSYKNPLFPSCANFKSRGIFKISFKKGRPLQRTETHIAPTQCRPPLDGLGCTWASLSNLSY